jgi:hypothetical protein
MALVNTAWAFLFHLFVVLRGVKWVRRSAMMDRRAGRREGSSLL